MQHLVVNTAIPVDLEDKDWTDVAMGRRYNHKYGFGKLDAERIVNSATQFKSVRSQVTFESERVVVEKDIIERSAGGLSSVITVSRQELVDAGFGRLEHVTVTVNITHTRRGQLGVDLVSPNNVTSHLASRRPHDVSVRGLTDWTFMTVKHWQEEHFEGPWTLRVYTDTSPGRLLSWRIKFWGEASEEYAKSHIDTHKTADSMAVADPQPARNTAARLLPADWLISGNMSEFVVLGGLVCSCSVIYVAYKAYVSFRQVRE